MSLGDATDDQARARWHQSANIERALPAGQGREVVHPDGSLTRVDDAASTSLGASDPPMPEDGSDGVVRLERGQLWHEADPASPPGQRFDVHLPRIRVMSKDGTFAVMVEHDGSSFVTAIAGDVAVVGDDDVAVHIAPLDAALMSPEGLIVDAILSTPDELLRDSWIGPNLRLSGVDAGNVRLPSETPRFEPRPAPAATIEAPAEAAPAEAALVEAPAEEQTLVEAPAAGAVAEAPAVEIAEPLRVSADEVPPASAATITEAEPETVEEAPAQQPAAEQPAAEQPAAARAFSWDWGTASTSGAATVAAEPAVEEAEPELVVPAEVLEGRDRSGVVEEAELEEEEPASPARAMVAAALVLIGLIIVVIAIRGLLHSESPQDVTPAGSTSTVPEGGGSTGSTAATNGGTTGSTAKGGSTTTTAKSATAARYTVHPTRCAQSGNQLTAEGTITNLDTTNHSYRIKVIFTTDGTNQAATASAEVSKAQPNKPAPWTMSTSYSGDLSKSGGCRVGSVDIIN